jgi:EAL domain-containing protein (putative c-di-GMP-specific phosphodiesterase class I)/GGDEF domain-containing protein
MIARNVTSRTAGLYYAFQPIVGVHSGETYGYEALLRGTRERGFASIADFFTEISRAGEAAEVELELLEEAATEFSLFAGQTTARLFFNQNNRVFDDPAYRYEVVAEVLERCDLPMERLCIELSEVDPLDFGKATAVLRRRGLGPILAIDDFGSGYSGLRLLAESRPNLVKIDRYFIAGVDREREKKQMLSHIISLAHSLGMMVIAEGVETEAEFTVCRDLGCDFAQGYLIARPTAEIAELSRTYAKVGEMVSRDRRESSKASVALREAMEAVPSISIDAPMAEVLKAFQNHHERSFFPVVGAKMETLGIVHEYKLKSLIYSPFGRQILTSVVSPQALRDYLTPALSFDINTNVDLVLGAIAQRPDVSAVLLTENDRYAGLLDTAGIIKTMHDRLLAGARDANPLSKLPGNEKIAEHMLAALESGALPLGFIYLDFDNFKPFNDRFGFRIGDRAIAMFADALRASFGDDDVFLGHIGGDDFFIGTAGSATLTTFKALPDFIARFGKSVESFYDETSRRAGFTAGVARDGSAGIPLLSVSGAGLVVRGERPAGAIDAVSQRLAQLKSRVKRSASKFEFEIFEAPTGGP